MRKSMRPGGGGRFQSLARKIEKKRGYSPGRAKAIAASIGRRKYGNKKFQAMAKRGKKRHAR